MKRYRRLAELPFATALEAYPGGLDEIELSSGDDYERIHFDATRFDRAQAPNLLFNECAFTEVTFDGGRLRGTRFHDAWLGGSRLVGVDLAESSWLDAVFDGAVLAGVQAFSSRLRRVVFQRCKLDSVNFRTAVLKDVIFEDCSIKDADFGGATLQRTSFPGSTLAGADFSKATLTDVDLRGAELLSLSGIDSLRGATIDTGQLVDLAAAFATVLGITVRDSPGR